MHKMMFPFENWNSVSKGSFREFRPFSIIAENHWPYYPFERVPVDRGASGEADRIGFSMKAQLLLRRADRFVLHLELILSLINRCGCKLSFRCEGQPDVHEYTCTNANEMSTQNADKSLISNAASIGGPIEV